MDPVGLKASAPEFVPTPENAKTPQQKTFDKGFKNVIPSLSSLKATAPAFTPKGQGGKRRGRKSRKVSRKSRKGRRGTRKH